MIPKFIVSVVITYEIWKSIMTFTLRIHMKSQYLKQKSSNTIKMGENNQNLNIFQNPLYIKFLYVIFYMPARWKFVNWAETRSCQ
jgi:hypothetical protein